MLKKITFIFLMVSSLFFLPSLKVEASSHVFSYTNLYADYYALLSSCTEIPSGSENLSIDIPGNNYTVFENGNIHSSISFYDDCEGTTLLEEIYFDEYAPGTTLNKIYTFDFLKLFEGQALPKSYKLTLVTNLDQAVAPSGLVDYMGTNTLFVFDRNPYQVKFISNLGVWETSSYLEFVSYPSKGDPTATDLFFSGWVTKDGEYFDFQRVPDEQYLINGTLYLYAYFVKDYDAENIPPWQSPGYDQDEEIDFGIYPPIGILLYNLGLYNTGGLMFMFFIIILIINVALTAIKIPTIASIITNLALTVIFMVLGYIPLYVSAILISFFIASFLVANKGGLLNNV